jgi:hypothetical protein
VFVVCRFPPPLPVSSPSDVAASASVEEMQEQLLAQEEELMWREEALAMQKEKVRIPEKALVKVSADIVAQRVKAEATRKEYLDKMEAHNTRAKHSLGLDKMLGAEGSAR